MAKSVNTFDHPSDVGLDAQADTPSELAEALAEGLADVICDRRHVQPQTTRVLELAAEDPEGLAVDFLTAVMNTIQVRHFMVASVAACEPADAPRRWKVVAQLAGEPYDPSKHEIKVEVKAVTYHQLRFCQQGERWIARVLLDL
jgi:SHS2 domain-containing protein